MDQVDALQVNVDPVGNNADGIVRASASRRPGVGNSPCLCGSVLELRTARYFPQSGPRDSSDITLMREPDGAVM